MREFRQNNTGGSRGGGRSFSGGGGGGRSFGGGGGGRDRGRPEMHRATCTDCGTNCEVPFKPTGNKPVLCSDCFGGGRDGGRDSGRDGGRSFGGGRDGGRGGRDFGGDRQMHKAICADCGSNCEVPFRPSGDKPVLCSDCFGGKSPSRAPAVSNEKHDEILVKLDKILNLLQRTSPIKEVTIMKEKKEEKKAEEAPEKAPAKKKTVTKKKAVKKTPAKKAVAKIVKKKAPAKKKTATKKK